MKTPLQSSVDFEHEVLTTDMGRSLLEHVARVGSPGPAELVRWRALAPTEWVHAAIRLRDCRRRGAAKYSRAEAMWLDPTGLEQATAEIVARHKARRFQANRVVDLCSGIGGDTIALAERCDVIAVDRDQGMCRRLSWNAGVYEVRDRVQPIVADAERFTIPPGAWVHVDPDRRAGGLSRARRVRRIEDYQPGLTALKSLCLSAAGCAIKLSPASDFEAHFAGSGYEVELISLEGECKEATVWAGGAVTCRRRATRLPDGVTWTDRDGDSGHDTPILLESAWSWIYDPDPALTRSGLLNTFATAHSLGRISREVDYLVGPSLVSSPFLAAFEVMDVFPLDLKRLRRELSKREIGRLEIKIRGVEVAPEALRAKLKLNGNRRGTLLVAGANPTRAVLARRIASN
jgi:hypothetical protein